MKIPASKVPAQVWADRARAHYGNLKKMEKDVLGYWEENKQVYRMNDALWDEMSIDEAGSFRCRCWTGCLTIACSSNIARR